MLKHEDNPDILSQPAAQVRVTPEELATAVSRIEARKDTDQRRADGTIPIGEAVQQLGLGVTPEEVLAEVRAARAQRATQRKGPSPRQRLGLMLGVGIGLVGLVGWWSVPRVDPNQVPPHVALSVPQTVLRRLPLDPNLLVGDKTGKLVMLSEVGDEQPVRCGYFAGGLRQYTPGGTGVTWILIKHGGRVYIRGWMLKMSPKALAANGTGISASRTSSHVVAVTLPVDGFMEKTPDTSGTQMYSDTILPVEDVRLDKHAYEKWNP